MLSLELLRFKQTFITNFLIERGGGAQKRYRYWFSVLHQTSALFYRGADQKKAIRNLGSHGRGQPGAALCWGEASSTWAAQKSESPFSPHHWVSNTSEKKAFSVPLEKQQCFTLPCSLSTSQPVLNLFLYLVFYEVNWMQLADVKRVSGLVGTSQCSQCGAREFCWFGFSNFPKVILMCFLQRTWGWNESHCSTEIVSLEQSSIGMWVLETAMGNVFACTRHSIWTNQYWAFYRGSGRGEELIGLGLQNVDFKIRPVITGLKNIFSHKASVDLTEMSWKKCEVFFVFSHAMYLFVKLCNKYVLSLFSRLDIWHHTKIRLFFLHSWIAIHGGNNIFTYTTLYSKETTKRKIYRRSTSIEQIPEDFFTELFCFHVSIVLIEPTTFSCT